jgi:hypothetical protein
LEALNKYAWTGHSAILGTVKRVWQDTHTILAYFGRRRGEKIASDERILGSSEFVQGFLNEVNEREKETLRLREHLTDLPSLARQIGREEGITEAELRSGSRNKKISKARRRFGQLAVVKLGYPRAQAVRFLGVTTSAVVRADNSGELPRIGSHP